MGSFVCLESLFVLGVCVLGLSFSYETPGSDTLLSRNSTVTASSNHPHNIFDVSHAVDGSTRTDSGDCNCCASTAQQNQPWIQIDLGNIYEVTAINVVGLTDLNYSISEISIYLHDERTNWIQNHTLVEKIAEENVQYYNNTLANPVKARYVTLQSQENEFRLSVCEVNIYGKCPAGKFGFNCSSKCHCFENKSCDRITGSCPDNRCDLGWQGSNCSEECPSGKHGSNCEIKCDCSEKSCDRITGLCPVNKCSKGKGAINLTTPDVQVSMSSAESVLDAAKAIDGHCMAGPQSCNCCSETNQGDSSWWQVDLGRPFFVKQLVVYARFNENEYKHLVGFSVFTSLTEEFAQTAVFTSQDQTIQDNKVVVDLPDIAARFVRIQRAGTLTICEIEIIHLDINCPVHKYGLDCAPCGPCNNGSCDPVIGVCPYGCYEGYIGDKCETFDTVTTKVTSGFVGAGALGGLQIVVAVVICAVFWVKKRRTQIYEQTMVKWTKGPTTNDSEYCTLDEQERQRRVTIEVKPAEESATDEPELMKEIGPELRLTGFDFVTSCLDRVVVK